IDCSSSWGPRPNSHPPPPISHAPNPTRVISSPVDPNSLVASCVCCIVIAPSPTLEVGISVSTPQAYQNDTPRFVIPVVDAWDDPRGAAGRWREDHGRLGSNADSLHNL